MTTARNTLFLILLGICLPSLALAKPGDKDRATKMFHEANALRAGEKFEQALEMFKAARVLYPSYKISLNIALTQQDLGRLAHAGEEYERFIWEGKGEISRQMLALAREKVAGIRASHGRLRIDIGERQGDVVIDGKPRGRAGKPWPNYLAPGEHKVEVRFNDGGVARVTLTLAAGEVKVQTFKPAPEPVSAAAPARSVPMAEEARDIPRRRLWTIAAWSSLGVGLASAAAAAAMCGVGLSRGNDAHDAYMATSDRDEIQSLRQDIESADGLLTGGTVLAGLAGAAVVTSVVLFIKRPSKDSERADLRWGVSPAEGGAAVSLAGRFR